LAHTRALLNLRGWTAISFSKQATEQNPWRRSPLTAQGIATRAVARVRKRNVNMRAPLVLSSHLAGKEIQRLRQVPAPAFLRHLVALVALLVTTALVIVHTTGAMRLLFQAVMGCILAHGTELVHQCIHRTGTGRVAYDGLLGTVLSWPGAVCFQYYRFFHLHHHKENGSASDAESFGYTYQMMESLQRSVRLLGLLRHLSMIDHLVGTFQRLVFALFGRLAAQLRAEAPQMGNDIAKKIQAEYTAMFLVYASALFASILLHSSVLVDVWLIPLVFWAPVHALIELPEHWATGRRPNINPFWNTRTIRAGRFATGFTNFNNYHVEHHLVSFIPMQRLPEMHQFLVQTGQPYGHLEESYGGFYSRFLTFIWNRSSSCRPTCQHVPPSSTGATITEK
jgi:fatty acid desaturase